MAQEKEQAKKPMRSKKVNVSTQEYIDISEIRDDTVVLKNGSIRAVLLVSSMNFALKSEEEQDAAINAYLTFLNSLDFPLQIVVQSRQLDIDDYLERLKKMEAEQKSELLRIQTASYRQFVAEMISLGNIMSKRFYAVVPYDPAQDTKKGFISRLSEILAPAKIVRLKSGRFEKYKRDLDRRVDHVANALQSFSLTSERLDTQGLIELYYNTYNPHVSQRQKMTDVSELRLDH